MLRYLVISLILFHCNCAFSNVPYASLKNNGNKFLIGVVIEPDTITNPESIFECFRFFVETGWAKHSVPTEYVLTSKSSFFIYKKITKTWVSNYIDLNDHLIRRGNRTDGMDVIIFFYKERKKIEALEKEIGDDIKKYFFELIDIKGFSIDYKQTIKNNTTEILKILASNIDISKKGIWNELINPKELNILISKDESIFPFAFIEKNKVVGYDIDIGKKIADAMKVKFKINMIEGTFDDIINKLINKHGDIAFFISKSEDRLNKTILIPYLKVKRVLIILNVYGNRQIVLNKLNTREAFIYTRQGSVYSEIAHKMFPEANINTFNGSLKTLYKNITKYESTIKMGILTNKARLDDSNIKQIKVMKLQNESLCLAIRSNCPLLKQVINSNINQNTKYKDITNSYMRIYLNL